MIAAQAAGAAPWWFVLTLAVPVGATMFWFMFRLFGGRWITDPPPDLSPIDEERWSALQEEPDRTDPP